MPNITSSWRDLDSHVIYFITILQNLLALVKHPNCRDGLVGYDGRFTRGRSRVRLPVSVFLLNGVADMKGLTFNVVHEELVKSSCSSVG